MKFPHLHRPKLDLRSPDVQTSIEIAVGGLLFAALMRWMEM